MNIPDLINGSFEFMGSIALWWNVRKLYHDKEYNGISIPSTAFFFFWGGWNLFFYPHLNQWFSFLGGLSMVCANLVWAAQMIYYARRQYKGTAGLRQF